MKKLLFLVIPLMLSSCVHLDIKTGNYSLKLENNETVTLADAPHLHASCNHMWCANRELKNICRWARKNDYQYVMIVSSSSSRSNYNTAHLWNSNNTVDYVTTYDYKGYCNAYCFNDYKIYEKITDNNNFLLKHDRKYSVQEVEIVKWCD